MGCLVDNGGETGRKIKIELCSHLAPYTKEISNGLETEIQ